MKFITHTYIFITIIILYSCANQTAPTGGPRDEDPPMLINSDPLNQSINFDDEQISLEFNEDVVLSNPNQEIIITPRIDQDIEYTARKNQVLIRFDDKLRDSTTYSINFREAIQDITEGNPVDLVYAFSTGPYIDSLSLSGIVKDLILDEALSEITVALQEPIDTTDYFNVPALYFTKTNEDGQFAFSNLKAGSYRLYAFQDTNNDIILQPSREAHGFIPDVIQLTTDTSDYLIPIIRSKTDTLKLISDRQSGLYYELNYNKPIVDYSVDFLFDSVPYLLDETFKLLRFYNVTNRDPFFAFVNVQDSIGYQRLDTIQISTEATVRKPFQFSAGITNDLLLASNPLLQIKLSLNKPLRRIIPDSITIFQDTLKLLSLNKDDINFDSTNSVITIKLQLEKDLFAEVSNNDVPTSVSRPTRSSNELVVNIPRGSIISVDNDTLTSIEKNIKVYRDYQIGKLFLEDINIPFDHYIIELLTGNGEVLERKYSLDRPFFNNLLPKNYSIRILDDPNGDQFWDIGNIYTNDPPDRILYYTFEGKKEIAIRANFEVAIPFDFSDVDN